MKDYASLADEQLALLYSEGDFRAFDQLLERNQQKLFSYILFVVHDPEVANDVFQETFVKVITKLQDGKYSDTGKFHFWLIRIAHNVIMDNYRHQKSAHFVEPTEDNDLNKLRSNDLMDINRENEYVNTQVMADVRRLMDALPAPQREVVYMRFYQDLSFKEISEITGVSINTSLGRMRYALINMRRMARQHNIQLNMEL
jgi:RNA polymerase sigma-70 factor (ECF subfamily)